MKRLILSTAFVATVSLPAAARSGTESEVYPALPEPPPVYQGETVEPEVTIIDTGQERIYEYRVRGQLYMVKVQPQAGPPLLSPGYHGGRPARYPQGSGPGQCVTPVATVQLVDRARARRGRCSMPDAL